MVDPSQGSKSIELLLGFYQGAHPAGAGHLIVKLDQLYPNINIIVGRPAASGDSTSARKAYARAAVGKRPRHHLDPEISFQPDGEEYPDHDDALVIIVRIANARVKQIMIDIGSVADILYFEAFQKLGLTDQDLTPLTSMLIGFTGDSIAPLRTMTLPLTIGEEPHTKTLMVIFMVVDLPSAYNAIIGQPTLNKLRAVVSTFHRSVNLHVDHFHLRLCTLGYIGRRALPLGILGFLRRTFRSMAPTSQRTS
ncbi:hypothetical protein B296_00043701 [Ensete ventricosum]|uniref:Reverse transcriptase domain-containing protein n=1 Tax=Ensete ventricosum TaxID=4639 RepID=A0A426XPM5_ENSVE|nr:hypothetical protein B296_00043701 [Ensete ventricosum]